MRSGGQVILRFYARLLFFLDPCRELSLDSINVTIFGWVDLVLMCVIHGWELRCWWKEARVRRHALQASGGTSQPEPRSLAET